MEYFDTLKIEGKNWFAVGSYIKTPEGRDTTERLANEIRKRGGKARIITRKNDIQVYGNHKKYVR